MQNWNKLSRHVVCLLGLLISPNIVFAADYWQLNMYKGVTPISNDIYELHMIALIVCAFIGVGVFGVMIYSLIRHRKSKGYIAASFHDNTVLEIFWSIVPFLILIGLAVPATKILLRAEDSNEADLTIKVVGYQWRWEYQYLDQGIHFFSNLATPYAQIQNKQKKGEWYLLEVDKPLVVPINKKVRFLVTSNDVIHSWWVPELGIKRDAIPGFMRESWARIKEPGVYRGQCAELCGINHAFMPIVVEAVSEDQFNEWVNSQPKTANQNNTAPSNSPALLGHQAAQNSPSPVLDQKTLLHLGKQKYETFCSACHGFNGEGIPPMYPALKGSSIAVGKPIQRHLDVILEGIPGSAMQAYKHQLTDTEIAAIATYERNAWENNTNDIIQPADVKNARQADIQQPKMVKKAQVGGFR